MKDTALRCVCELFCYSSRKRTKSASECHSILRFSETRAASGRIDLSSWRRTLRYDGYHVLFAEGGHFNSSTHLIIEKQKLGGKKQSAIYEMNNPLADVFNKNSLATQELKKRRVKEPDHSENVFAKESATSIMHATLLIAELLHVLLFC